MKEQHNLKRTEIQQKAKEAFLRTNHKACLEIGTGVGKTKIATDIVSDVRVWEHSMIDADQFLVLMPSTELKTRDWPEHFRKFGIHLDSFIFECYQTAYKWRGRKFLAVIADEFDFSLTEKYSEFYFHNEFEVLIALTATIPENKRELANAIAPTCFKYSTQDAQRDGILNKTKFYQVNYDLGHTKSIEVKYGDGKRFMQSENGMYLYLQEKFTTPLFGLKKAEAAYNTASIADDGSDGAIAAVQAAEKHMKKLEGQVSLFSRKRKEFLHTLASSRKVAKVLIESIHRQPGNKILVFSKLTQQIDQICQHTHHAKNKETQEDKIALFNSGSISTLGVCESINRGANLHGANTLIKESYIGADVDFQQQHGRGTRLEIDEVMSMFFLVPYYWVRMEVVDLNAPGGTKLQWVRQPTQAMTWFLNMTEQFDLSGMEIIEMVHNQREDKYSLPPEYDNRFR